jgi:predicted dehydrogenase
MINLGILGCGDVAFRTYLPGLQLIRDRARIVACSDPLRERGERLAAAAGGEVQVYTSLETMIEQPGLDAVINLTPAPLHLLTNTMILQAGLHLFSEKPVAGTVADAQGLIALAREKDRLLLVAPAVAATNRFRWLRGLLDSGQLGTPTFATAQMANLGPAAWRDYKGDPAIFYSEQVGPVVDLGVYLLHGLTALFGPARRVQAFGGVTIPERTVLIPSRLGEKVMVTANDVMLIGLDFGDNVFAQVVASFAVPRSKAPALEVHASGGSISIAPPIWYDTNAPVDLVLLQNKPDVTEEWQPAAPPDRTDLSLIQVGPAHLVACLEGTETPILTAEHATHVLEIMLAAGTSVDEGRAVPLETTF